MPRVSVVVPVKDRRDLLVALLESLDHQTFDDFEVIVVDDHSSDGADRVAAEATVQGRPVRVIANASVGAVEARRTGVAESTSPYIAFTDSDCVPDSDWLRRGSRALEAGADMVNGRTVAVRTPGPLERTLESGEEDLYPTCNMFFRRTAYDAAGGFDVDVSADLGFRPGPGARGMGFGEDTILAWRIRRSGARVVYEPEAIVAHHVFPPDLRDSFHRAWMSGAFPALVRAVPELRKSTLMKGPLFHPVRSRLPVYATVAALISRRRTFVLLGAGWWAATRLGELRHTRGSWSRRFAALPVEMAYDAVFTAAIVTGSAWSRTFVL